MYVKLLTDIKISEENIKEYFIQGREINLLNITQMHYIKETLYLFDIVKKDILIFKFETEQECEEIFKTIPLSLGLVSKEAYKILDENAMEREKQRMLEMDNLKCNNIWRMCNCLK